MGVDADVYFKTNLDVGYVGGVGPVRVVTDAGDPFEVAVVTPAPLHAVVDSIGKVGPVEIAGIPDKFTFDINVNKLPKILVGLDPITVNPVALNLSLKEIPSVRAHLPADYNLGLSILGLELFCLRLCGEAQIITEPYEPNPCEHCGPPHVQPPTPVTPVTPATPGLANNPSVSSGFSAARNPQEKP